MLTFFPSFNAESCSFMHILNSILKPLCLLDRSTLALANLTAIHLHLTNWTLILSLCRDLQILPLVQAFSSSIRAFSCHLHISLVSVYSLIRTVSTTSNFQLWISSIPSKNFSKQTCCSSNINVTGFLCKISPHEEEANLKTGQSLWCWCSARGVML